MRKAVLLWFVFMLIIPSTVTASAESKWAFQRQANLSTWLWDTAHIVKAPDKVISNLVKNDVDVVMLQIDRTIDLQTYRNFIRKAAAKKIKVEALDGAPQWASKGGVKLQNEFAQWFHTYQNKASATEKFTGIHLDVEPYELDGFEANRDKIIEAYQAMIITFKKQAKQLRVDFGIDIPFWFYGVQYENKFGEGNIAEWLCQHVKRITIMAYQDQAKGENGIIRISAKEMDMFKKYKVKGTIAVETGKLAGQYAFVTFFEESKAYMNEQLELVYQKYKSHAAFQGIAIHYYDSWIAMK